MKKIRQAIVSLTLATTITFASPMKKRTLSPNNYSNEQPTKKTKSNPMQIEAITGFTNNSKKTNSIENTLEKSYRMISLETKIKNLGYTDLIKLLKKLSFNYAPTDDDIKLISENLIYAATKGHVEVLRYLIEEKKFPSKKRHLMMDSRKLFRMGT